MTDQPPMPKIERVTLPVCELCMKGEGEVCHAPGCVFCRHDVIKDLKCFAISTEPPPAFIITEGEIALILVKAEHDWVRDYVDKKPSPRKRPYKSHRELMAHYLAALLTRAGGRVIDVVALSLKCLAAVHNNEYMEKQLDGIQVAILNAIEGVDTEGEPQ